MPRWLFKSEPDCYSLEHLKAEGSTLWDGISNAQALGFLRQCKAGDLGFFYHTGKEKAIVGVLRVTGEAVPDPAGESEKELVLPVEFAKALKQPVTLKAIKADPAFAEWELVKNSRLAVMPCPMELWKRVEAYAAGKLPEPAE